MNAHKHTASNLRACITALLEDEERGCNRKHLDDFLAELANASNAHLSQSTRPEGSGGSIGGQYSVEQGNARSYLKNAEGFTVAQTHTWGESGLQDLQRIASHLNQLEALRASHGELYSLLREHEESRSYGGEKARRYCLSPLSSNTRQALSKAHSLICPTKTPTAAPRGQQ